MAENKKNIKYVIMLASFILLFTVCPVFSQEYLLSQFSIKIELDNQGNIHEKVHFRMENLGEENITSIEYSLIKEPLNFQAYCKNSKIKWHIENGSVVVLDLPRPLSPRDEIEIEMEYTIPKMAIDYGKNKILTFSYIPETKILNYSLIVFLPEKSSLASEVEKEGESLSTVYPTPTSILTDGKRIIIEWRRKILSPGENFRIFIMYTQVNKKPSYIMFLLGIGIGIIATYVAIRKKTPKEKIIKLVLGEDEKKIYNLIVERGGSMLQDEIVKETGFSKAKVSKLLRKLEEKGIIKREPFRKTNKVYLKKEFGGKH